MKVTISPMVARPLVNSQAPTMKIARIVTVADVRAAVTIPVVANGEIWSVLDADRCLRESGASALMLGRGAVVDPALAWRLRQTLDWPDPTLGPARPGLLDWPALLPHIDIFWRRVCERIEPRARAGRLKQWLNFLRRASPQAEAAYQQLRTVNDSMGVGLWLQDALIQARACPEELEVYAEAAHKRELAPA